jgi:hypothetical protein
LDTQSVIARTITVAGGRYAPGHLGELTQHLPFEMVDEALAATRTTQARLRDLPSRVVVYLVLAACLFPEIGYCGVWRKLTAALAQIAYPNPSSGGLAAARHRIGAAPLRWLFDLLRGPAATPEQRGTRWRGLVVCAIDGTTLTVPDNPRTLARFTKQRGNHGGTGYPQIRLVALLACGTRTVIDAVFGPTTTGETTYTPRLLRSLHAGMILLGDRNFGAQHLLAQIAATQALRCPEFLGQGSNKMVPETEMRKRLWHVSVRLARSSVRKRFGSCGSRTVRSRMWRKSWMSIRRRCAIGSAGTSSSTTASRPI